MYISHHRVQNLKFEQTLQPVLFSYSLSLSLSITSPFMALFSVESMVSGYTMLTRTTWCRTATKEGGCLNPFLVAVMTGETVTGYVLPSVCQLYMHLS